MSETILITGAAGFLGSHLAERALRRGDRVLGVDNFATGSARNVEFLTRLDHEKNGDRSQFQFLEADVCQPWETWTSAVPDFVLNQISLVYHFASPASPPHYQELALPTLWVNSIGTRNALEFADTVGARVVFASTSEIYGDPLVSPQPESYWGNVNTVGVRSCYDEAKRFGESLIYTHNWKKQTKHGFVRIFNTYGPRMNPADGRVIINFLAQALRREALTVYGDGQQTRSFCYVEDLCDGIEKYAHTKRTEPVNLGNEKEFTILELVEVIRKIFPDRQLTTEMKPMPADDPKRRRPDLTRARDWLAGWEPRVTLAEGLQKMRAWLETEIS